MSPMSLLNAERTLLAQVLQARSIHTRHTFIRSRSMYFDTFTRILCRAVLWAAFAPSFVVELCLSVNNCFLTSILAPSMLTGGIVSVEL